MRWEFQQRLHDLMVRDERVHLLWCDVGAGLFRKHMSDFPTRVLNMGICEQATVSMAAGMALEGLRPIVYTILPFLIERAFEQIKIDVDQMHLPVGLVGHSDSASGPTHIELNAPVMMGLLKNVHSYFPKTKEDVGEMLLSVDLDAPWFMALKTL